MNYISFFDFFSELEKNFVCIISVIMCSMNELENKLEMS